MSELRITDIKTYIVPMVPAEEMCIRDSRQPESYLSSAGPLPSSQRRKFPQG